MNIYKQKLSQSIQVCSICVVMSFVVAVLSQPNYKYIESELEINKAIWDSNNFKSYVVTVGRQCECSDQFIGPFDVTVENKEITHISPMTLYANTIPSIEKIYEVIKSCILEKYVVLHVSYDKTYGYPRSVAFDKDGTTAASHIVNYVFDLKDTKNGKIKTKRNNQCLYKCNGNMHMKLSKEFDDDDDDLPVIGKGWNDQDRHLFKVNKNKWFNCGINEYRYKLIKQVSSDQSYSGPFIIGIKDDFIEEVYQSYGDKDIPIEITSEHSTINSLFDFIERNAQSSDNISIKYDNCTGMPIIINIDVIALAIGDELTLYTTLL